MSALTVVAIATAGWSVAPIAVGVAAASSQAQAATVAAAAAKPPPLWEDNFANPQAVANWAVITGKISDKKKSQAHFLASNVFPKDGNLVLRSQRHCVKDANTKPTDDNASAKVCDGKRPVTKYSSGRVHRGAGLAASSGNFRIEFKATLPADAVTGTRSALWMKNAAPYCDADGVTDDQIPTDLGELDALEWYGERPGRTTATTHMACHGKNNLKTRQEPNKRDDLRAGSTHTWTVERWGNRIKYWIDGHRVGDTDACGKGELNPIKQDKCDRILNLPWLLIMQGEVFKKGDNGTGYTAPDDSKPFPQQRFLIHWVRAYQLAAGGDASDPDAYELEAIGGSATGARGSTVQVKVAARNNGPATTGGVVTVTAPEGTEIAAAPEGCTIAADRKTAVCDGGDATIPVGKVYEAAFSFTITGPVTKDGSVRIEGRDPGDESKSENNAAPIKITVAPGGGGGGGDDDPELPVTGTSVGVAAGLGALLLAAGGVLLVLGRRRRLALGKHGLNP